MSSKEQLPGTIAAAVSVEIVINRSRFIAAAFPVQTVAEADAIIAAIRKEHWTANHNCVAMIVGEQGESQRSSDDGEPSGTAGVPMLEVLRRRNLTDVLVVVTRYFGGILLGAGGLVRAYSGAVAAVLDEAQVLQRQRMNLVAVETDYLQAGKLENALHTWAQTNGSVMELPSYADKAVFSLLVPDDSVAPLAELVRTVTGGQAECHVIGQQIVAI